MRISYRNGGNRDYWSARWGVVPADGPMHNKNIYPLKYAEYALKFANGNKILEAGCGAGRILRHYHDRGFEIFGFDFIEEPIFRLKNIDPALRVEVGDVTSMHYPSESFDVMFSFGLLHNLEFGLENAVSESCRVLRHGGILCASFRADNLQNQVVDFLALRKFKEGKSSVTPQFHKLNLKKSEFIELLIKGGFEVLEIFPVSNMPFLFKFKIFRSKESKVFNEATSRLYGYKLNFIGNFLQFSLMRAFPNQFCNVYVAIARKIRV
jgi:SAM-dependent methyltransferase